MTTPIIEGLNARPRAREAARAALPRERNSEFCSASCYYEGSMRATCAAACHVTEMLGRPSSAKAARKGAAAHSPRALSLRDAARVLGYAALNQRGVRR